MSNALPQTDEAIRAEFSDRFNYFSLMRMVASTRGTKSENLACAYARRVMLLLGYPAETATFDDSRVIRYAENIVCLG